MIYKIYGKTNKRVSAVGFGGMRFDMDKTEEENAGLLLYAASKGINYFDTAPGYCRGKSEIIFGQAFKQMKREDFFVSTKNFPQACKDKQGFLDEIKKQCERLNVECIDFYHIWCLRNMSHYELAMKPNMEYDALLEAKELGIVEHIVCSSHQSGSDIRYIVEDGKVEGVLMGLNILNFPYRWEGVEACVENNLGIVAMNPLMGGAIPQHEQELSYLCKGDETPTDAALRFCISSPITVTLNGITAKAHIDRLCKAADNASAYTKEDLEEIRIELGENMDSACTGCGYCLKGCPVNINIAAYLQIYNEKQMFNKTDEQMIKILDGSHKYGTLVGIDAWAGDCIECGNCETECTQHLNVIDRLKELAAWEALIPTEKEG